MEAVATQIQPFEAIVAKAERLCDMRNEDALPLVEEAQERAALSGNIIAVATSKYLRAYFECFVRNNYDNTIDIISSLLDQLESDDLEQIGHKLFMVLGNAFQFKGDVYEAQQTYLKGIRLLEHKATISSAEKKFHGAYYYNIALLLCASQYRLDTEDYLKRAIDIYEELQEPFKLSMCYLVYGSFFEKAGNNEAALREFRKALDISTASGDEYSIALIRSNMGYVANNLGQYSQAESHFSAALQYFEGHQRQFEIGMTKMGIGVCYFKTGARDVGLTQLYAAEKIFVAMDNKQELSECHKKLAALLAEDGQCNKAYHYLQLHNEALLHFFDTEKTNALARAKKEFESEQKEKEAHLLKQKNEEIQQYVIKLEHSNNSLKQFAHVASHDLREPVRMIQSYLTLLERSLGSAVTESQREFLGFAVGGAKRMDRLIVDLLQLAKVDANPRIECVRLENVVDEIRLNLSLLLNEKNAAIISGNLPSINADRTQILQLFQNLIGNGLKYNENKNPVVKVKYVQHHDTFDLLISDNGIGIPAHSRERVFEIFTRLTTDKEYSGTGIGLSICKKIVDGLNGKITITDGVNGGTTFKITLKNELLNQSL
ncbi:MAG: ATP-binding protein [Chitinophagales bacterium]